VVAMRNWSIRLITELIGWTSSVILLLTIAKQIHKQWVTRTSAGVSKWLFIGQLAASIGFTIYSCMLQNWVFVATNVLMTFSALVGIWIVISNRSKQPPANPHHAD
jgi:MtN3 and saliva related transmembrane protein